MSKGDQIKKKRKNNHQKPTDKTKKNTKKHPILALQNPLKNRRERGWKEKKEKERKVKQHKGLRANRPLLKTFLTARGIKQVLGRFEAKKAQAVNLGFHIWLYLLGFLPIGLCNLILVLNFKNIIIKFHKGYFDRFTNHNKLVCFVNGFQRQCFSF